MTRSCFGKNYAFASGLFTHPILTPQTNNGTKRADSYEPLTAAAGRGRYHGAICTRTLDAWRIAINDVVACCLWMTIGMSPIQWQRFFASLTTRSEVAYSGEEALCEAGNYRPDVVIPDVNMPGMDGLQPARLLKRDRRLSSKPFIAHTAADEPLVRQVATQIGFSHLVVKGGESLLATVDALCDAVE